MQSGKLIFPLLLFTLIAQTSFSQNKKAFFQIGISGNTYKGDLQESYDKLASGVHFGIRVHGEKRVNAELLFHAGSITGQNVSFNQDNPSITPNTFFKTRLLSGQFNININLIRKENFRLYLSQGIGLLSFDPENDLGEKLIDLSDTRQAGETYTTNTLMLPTGLGALYTLKNGFGFALRLSYLNPQTDYLDNISAYGTSDKNDRVFQTNFTFLIPFTLPSAKEKPTAKK